MMKNEGFTIIELIVVIAIIAVLSGIVMVNVQKSAVKGKNASMKANLSSIMTKGTIYFESDPTYAGSYQGFCNSPDVDRALTAITNAGGTSICNCNIANCGAGSTKWCACANEITSSGALNFCVDSTGFKKEQFIPFPISCTSRCGVGGNCAW